MLSRSWLADRLFILKQSYWDAGSCSVSFLLISDLFLLSLLLQTPQLSFSSGQRGLDHRQNPRQTIHTPLNALWAQDTGDLWPLRGQLAGEGRQLRSKSLKRKWREVILRVDWRNDQCTGVCWRWDSPSVLVKQWSGVKPSSFHTKWGIIRTIKPWASDTRWRMTNSTSTFPKIKGGRENEKKKSSQERDVLRQEGNF